MHVLTRRTALAGVTTGIAAVSLTLTATTSALASTAGAADHGTGATSTARRASAVPSAPVTGTWRDPRSGTTGTLQGTFTPQRFAVQRGHLVATGTLTATVTDAAGAVVRTVKAPVTLPVALQRASSSAPAAGAARGSAALAPAPAQCNVLNLVLGPLNLNLLGLVVTLNQVNLNIVAVPGAGALLGNLLCAVAGLLDGAGALAQISALLNQILGILNGLGAPAAAASPAAVPALAGR